jgi:GR25 family glycosyltransferase involved in LPS biosynthesis
MIIKNTKKNIINLKRREDRKLLSKKEMEYMGWGNYEFFEAIDTNSYEGCGYSHMAIAKKLLDSNEEYIIVFEDDILFMPWAKEYLEKVEKSLQNTSFDIFNFAPSIHRPLESSENPLIKLHDCPPKDPNKHRGIFGTSGIIYNRKVAEMVIKWDTDELIKNIHKTAAIDEFFDSVIYPVTKSYCPRFPILSQRKDYSDINKTIDNNLYLCLYQWNSYISKLPINTYEIEYIMELRDNNKTFNL